MRCTCARSSPRRRKCSGKTWLWCVRVCARMRSGLAGTVKVHRGLNACSIAVSLRARRAHRQVTLDVLRNFAVEDESQRHIVCSALCERGADGAVLVG